MQKMSPVTKPCLSIFLVIICVSKCLSQFNCSDVNIDISEGVRNGDDIIFDGITYARDEYFISENGKIHGCICKKKTCVNKCCPIGQGYNIISKECVPFEKQFDPPVWNDVQKLPHKAASHIHFYAMEKVIDCSIFGEKSNRFRGSTLSESADKNRLQLDGNFYVFMPTEIPPYRLKNPEHYCIDNFVNGTSAILDALTCFDDEADNNHLNYIIGAPCMLISCVFILLTVAVYLFIPELRTLHGRVLITYLMCLFFGFLFMATMQLMLYTNTITSDLCIIFTFIIYFGLETAFFWLTVMSFDVWWTFSGKRGLSINKLSIRNRFSAYALFAFGVPLLLTILLAALEFADLEPHPLLPLIRVKACFLSGKSKLIYLYGPMSILCITNIVFFVLTAIQIGKSKKHASTLKSNESTTNTRLKNGKQRLLLYVKLFLLMGVNWVMEIISFLYPEPQALWSVTDIYNLLLGFTIFILFVCKRKIFHLIKKRFKQMRGEPVSRTQTTISSRTTPEDNFKMNHTSSLKNLPNIIAP